MKLFISIVVLITVQLLGGEYAKGHSCISLLLDASQTNIPLYKVNRKYRGHEFLLSPPIFSHPKSVREFVSQNSKFGEISINSGSSVAEFKEKAEAVFPSQPAQELSDHIQRVVEDAKRRKYRFKKIEVAVRTEIRVRGAEGFAHNHDSPGLSYAKAEIGPNTIVDSLDRDFGGNLDLPEDMAGFITSSNQSSVIVFGTAWHQIPLLKDGSRLWVGVVLTP